MNLSLLVDARNRGSHNLAPPMPNKPMRKVMRSTPLYLKDRLRLGAGGESGIPRCAQLAGAPEVVNQIADEREERDAEKKEAEHAAEGIEPFNQPDRSGQHEQQRHFDRNRPRGMALRFAQSAQTVR